MPESSRGGLPDHFRCTPDIESSSEAYARRFAGSTGSWFLDVQERAVLRLLEPWPGATILDVGGGHGQLAGPLARRGYRVTVLGSDDSCARRIADLVQTGLVRFTTGDLLRLPFPDRSFDVAVSFRILGHVPPWQLLVGELTRVADKAVIVDFASTRSVNFLSPLLFQLKRRIEGDTRRFHSFGERELGGAFRAHGFAPTGRRAQYFLPMVLHRAMRSRGLSAALERPFRWTGLTSLLGSPVVARFVRNSSTER